MIQGYLQQQQLHYYHQEGLYEQCRVEPGARVVEYPALRQVSPESRAIASIPEAPYLNMDAMSMIKGMSKEKPALDLLRCIDIAWSL